MVKASQKRSPSRGSTKFGSDERFKTPAPRSPGPKYKREESSPRFAKTLGARLYRPKTSCLINYPSTPESMGPGKYAINDCPVVREKSPRLWSFSKSYRDTLPIHKTSEWESYGYQSSCSKQVDSRHPSKHGVTIGRATRDQQAKAGMYY